MGDFVHVARAGTACRAPTEEKCKKRERESAGVRALAIVRAAALRWYRPFGSQGKGTRGTKEREDGYAKHL